MSKPKYILGSDPGVDRGPGMYAETPAPFSPDCGVMYVQKTGTSLSFGHAYYYAGPFDLEADPPDPPPIAVPLAEKVYPGFTYLARPKYRSDAPRLVVLNDEETRVDGWFFWGPITMAPAPSSDPDPKCPECGRRKHDYPYRTIRSEVCTRCRKPLGD